MFPQLVKLAVALLAASPVAALSHQHVHQKRAHQTAMESIPNTTVEKRSLSCSTLAYGLTAADCAHMSTIGMGYQGINSRTSNGHSWIGTDGPNTFTFVNNAGVPITLIVWENQWINANQPYVTYSIASGGSIVISLANNINGGWGALYNEITTLNAYGQLYNTVGEYGTGPYANVAISREINMGGNAMTIKLDSGCTCSMSQCAYVCYSGNTCGDSGTYNLLNCAAGSQTGAAGATCTYSGVSNPCGGCSGFANGGHGTVTFTN